MTARTAELQRLITAFEQLTPQQRDTLGRVMTELAAGNTAAAQQIAAAAGHKLEI